MLWRKHSAVALLVQSSKSTPLLQKALPPGWKCHCWNQFFPAKEKKMRDLSPKVVLRCSLSKFGINTLQQCGNNTLVLLDMPPCKWTFQTIMNGSSANFLRTFSKRNQSFYFFIYWYLDMDISANFARLSRWSVGESEGGQRASFSSPQVRSIQYHPGPAWWPNVEPCLANLSVCPPSTAGPPPTFGYFSFRSPMLAPPLSL